MIILAHLQRCIGLHVCMTGQTVADSRTRHDLDNNPRRALFGPSGDLSWQYTGNPMIPVINWILGGGKGWETARVKRGRQISSSTHRTFIV